MNFTRRFSRENFYLSSHSLKFGDWLAGWKMATNAKLQLNISKNYASWVQKNTGTRGVNTTIKINQTNVLVVFCLVVGSIIIALSYPNPIKLDVFCCILLILHTSNVKLLVMTRP